MTDARTNPNNRLPLWRRPWFKYAAAGLIVILALGWLLAPRRVWEVASVDDALRWRADEAPPRRSVVWRPAAEVESLPAEASAGGSAIRPQLADEGTTLYFTIRQNGHTDIYRSRREAGRWSSAEPITSWNTEHDDIGPVLTDDGRRAYLYSNRPGGYGGFDLYVSQRDGETWTRPRNLGPWVNSPAHEYDPAVTPDGRRLFFASNRTPQMQEQAASGENFKRGEPWNATLRAHLETLPFDLYVVERDGEKNAWTAPRPLTAINLPQSSEGSPFVAAGGAFLYFASDRPIRKGEAANFDLYRARLRGSQVAEIENLGDGVNTPQNELEPALSPEGFRLYFSRNREADDSGAAGETYTLYASTAVEVLDERTWDASRWGALVGWFAENWWWLILGLLLAALLAAIIWCLREISLRRAHAPVFFTLALLVHLFFVTGSFFVGLNDDLLSLLPQQMREVIVAEESYDDPNEAGEVPPQPFEQTADLENLEPPEPSEVVNAASPSTPPSPVTTAVRINASTPLPPNRLVYEAPAPQQVTPDAAPPKQELTLARRAAEVPTTDDSAMLEELPPAPAPEANPPQTPAREAVELARQSRTADMAAPPMLARQSVTEDQSPTREEVERVNTAEPNAAPANRASPQMARNEPTPAESSLAEQVAAEAISAPAAMPRATTPATDVEIARSEPQAAPSVHQRLEVAQTVEESGPTFDAEMIADSPTASAPPRTSVAPVDSPRRATLDVAASEQAPTIEAEQTPAAETVVRADAAEQLRADVSLSRQQTSAPVEAQRMTKEITLAAASPTAAESGALAPERAEADAAPESNRAAAALSRVASNSPRDSEAAEAIAMAEADLSPTEQRESTADGPQVAVARRAMESPDAAGAALAASSTESPTELVAQNAAAELSPEHADTPQPLASRASADLRRAARADDAELTETVETAPALAMADGENQDALESQVNAADVALARQNAALPGAAKLLPVSLARANGPSRVLSGGAELAEEPIDAAPEFGRSAANLARRESRSPLLMYAEDAIGLQAMLRLRQSEAKEDLLQAFGGSDQTEAAVRRGLAWLAQHQHRDGHWSMDRFHEMCREHHPNQPCGGGGRSADTAATGFALLPFLGAGHTHQEGDHQDCVSRGLTWLVSHQKENGDLFTGGGGNGHMYSHGVAAIALCEAYAMTKDPRLREPAQRAIDFIVHAQHKGSGGWRYSPGQDGDTSVFGWQIMALKSGQIAGLNVPQPTLELSKKWLERVGAKGNQLGQFGYTNPHPSPAMTAEALLCLQYLGAERNDPRLLKGGDYLLAHLPPADTSYYWYYGTQVMYHLQGEHWRQWNEAQRDKLVETQIKEGRPAGTWNPTDRWEREGGRIYATSLRLLMLEVYYRHLPLYQALE